MVEWVAREASKEILERFLGDFRRAWLMQRKTLFSIVFRLQFPESEELFEGMGDVAQSLDFRTWLPELPNDDIRENRLYRRLVEEQENLSRCAVEVMNRSRHGALSAGQLADLLRTVHVFDHLADRLTSGIVLSMTDVDDLTGLLNRTAMERDLARQMTESKHSGRAFTIAMVDVDHFKKVNDDFGHGFGDHVLETLAKRFEDSLRPRDRAYRYGGEEFLLLLPDTPLEQAAPVLERLRRRAHERVENLSASCDSEGHPALRMDPRPDSPFAGIDQNPR